MKVNKHCKIFVFRFTLEYDLGQNDQQQYREPINQFANIKNLQCNKDVFNLQGAYNQVKNST